MNGTYEIDWISSTSSGRLRVEAVPTMLRTPLFETLRKEVSELAVDLQSMCCGRSWVRIGQPLEGPPGARVRHEPGKADRSFVEWVDAFALAWRTIEESPCADLRQGATWVRSERARTVRAMRQVALQPERRFVAEVGRLTTFDTVEARWLALSLDAKIAQANTEISLLETESLLDDDKARRAANARVERDRSDAQAARDRLSGIRKSALFAGVQSSRALPVPTKRLMMRAGYAEAYRLIHDSNSTAKSVQELLRLAAIREVEAAGGVRKSSEIYEIWCFLKLYHDLRSQLGFEAVGAEPQHRLRLRHGLLELGAEEYRLRRTFAGGHIGIRLSYNVQHASGKRPDILMKVRAPKRALGGGSLTVVLDSKYHDFSALGRRSAVPGSRTFCFREDVEMVALEKYTHRLGADVSFILHPCENFEWRGERPYSEFIGDPAADLPKDERLTHPGHRIGALLFRPGHPEDTARLFTIVFLYHLGLTSLCVGCGSELTRANQFYKNVKRQDRLFEEERFEDSYPWDPVDPTTRFIAKCDCGRWWRVTFCRNGCGHHDRMPESRNRLIHHGQRRDPSQKGFIGIHEYPAPGRARCPRCGNLLSEDGDEILTGGCDPAAKGRALQPAPDEFDPIG